MPRLFYFFILYFLSIHLNAQQYEDFGFEKELTIVVNDSLQNTLLNPWAGGLNSCQFSPIDLNMDGIKDLFIYDRSNNKITTYLNNGSPNKVDYLYAPKYQAFFPIMHDWVMLLDYNMDGKEDIFTSAYSGIAVYKNISSLSSGLQFELVSPMITSMQGQTNTNLLVTTVDWPAISDIDNDGDLDILTFWGLGSFIEYHQNRSMELYGIPDSLHFVLQEYCWGKFAESEISNEIILDTTCPRFIPTYDEELRHTGSTLLAADLTGNGLKDLLIGDIGFPGIIKLTNGGTLTDAFMINQDTLFPSNSVKIDLFSMPAISHFDADNDGLKDLILSPFDGGLSVSENLKSCWFYKNTGTSTSPIFEFQYDNFLQNNMIDIGAGAYPVLFDYDNDGLKDLFIGNFGILDSTYYLFTNLTCTYKSGISLYKNIGNDTLPAFQLITNDFAKIMSRKLNGVVPTFGDIDGDQVPEMIIGKSTGKIDLYENIAIPGEPMNMVLSQEDYMGIHVGYPLTQKNVMSTPQLIDLDNDSLLDLVIGERNGNLEFFKNTGTKTTPNFTLFNDSLGGVLVSDKNVSNYGYSVPCFFKDSTNQLKLFVGSESGNIFYYKDIENNLQAGKKFTCVDSNYLYLNEGSRCGIAIAELTSDQYPELIIGNFSGGLTYFKGKHPNPVGIKTFHKPEQIQYDLYPNPADNFVYIKIYEKFKNPQIQLYSMSGNTISCKFKVNDNQISFSTATFPNGIYFFTLQGEKRIGMKDLFIKGKFIVNH